MPAHLPAGSSLSIPGEEARDVTLQQPGPLHAQLLPHVHVAPEAHCSVQLPLMHAAEQVESAAHVVEQSPLAQVTFAEVTAAAGRGMRCFLLMRWLSYKIGPRPSGAPHTVWTTTSVAVTE